MFIPFASASPGQYGSVSLFSFKGPGLFQLDLRAPVLEGQDLGAALRSRALMWTAGSPVSPDVEVIGQSDDLPEGVAHHVLRIAQEGVTNALKHAAAGKIALRLCIEKQCLTLEVQVMAEGSTRIQLWRHLTVTSA